MARKKKRRGDLLIKRDLLQRHSNQMQCVQHCLDPVSEKPIVKEIFMRQSGKFACLLFDDIKTFLFIFQNKGIVITFLKTILIF